MTENIEHHRCRPIAWGQKAGLRTDEADYDDDNYDIKVSGVDDNDDDEDEYVDDDYCG